MQPYLVFGLTAALGAMGELAGHERRGALSWPARSALGAATALEGDICLQVSRNEDIVARSRNLDAEVEAICDLALLFPTIGFTSDPPVSARMELEVLGLFAELIDLDLEIRHLGTLHGQRSAITLGGTGKPG